MIIFFHALGLFLFINLNFRKLARRISSSRIIVSLGILVLLLLTYFGRLFLKSCDYGLLQLITCIVVAVIFEHNNCVLAKIEWALVKYLCLSCLGWAVTFFVLLLGFAFFSLVFPHSTRFLVYGIRNAFFWLNWNNSIFVKLKTSVVEYMVIPSRVVSPEIIRGFFRYIIAVEVDLAFIIFLWISFLLIPSL